MVLNETIIGSLNELGTTDLVDLQNIIKHILNDREVTDNTIIEAVKLLCRGTTSYSIRYTILLLYLESHGLRREAIDERIIKMWRKNTSIATGGSPIGETETPDNPIYPRYLNERYYQICYLQCNKF
jgi:hypothetical protein